ncbi:hypothetical protein ABB37_09808 [Leptomonas pyrrhocoris]|uniref:Uncharacterized protein n=1 Tax=Leptomonas pyrrhocoris TaxID=157538 RepID=A0A0N0DQP6_LEPPY|nr:hypothetical protein ABB37_09808 [Leptomonas pyrrhocoris]KPA73488.1 hypothetical protein ABB37_09808 [Leptomonas pyrrhocoris]|eukprot:XP_015651927.1 hypothetical protein ABB37_09808 [Leptomonas pyrrhocoris]
MATTSSSFMVEETGVCVLLALRHRTIVASIEVKLLPPPSSPEKVSTFVVWALTVPRHGRSFADDFYAVAVPVPLGFVSCTSTQPSPLPPRRCPSRTAVLSLGRWELSRDTHVALLLAPPECAVDVVRQTLTTALHPKRRALPLTAEAEPRALPVLPAAHWRLCGSFAATPAAAADEAEWQPLLHRRWHELKGYVRQGTAVTYFPSFHHTRRADNVTSDSDEEGEEAPPMYAGDVREADAISMNRQYVRWADGGVGLYDEVKPFYRVYHPARQEKTIRVRRFPHRYADVVGEIPFGQCVEAFGRATDPFTQEQYVLLYLPAAEAFAPHIATYDLIFVEEGRYVWGWSKLAGSSGLPLLVERQVDGATSNGRLMTGASPMNATTTTASSSELPTSTSRTNAQEAGSKAAVMPLPEGTFYTPVREGRAVRIRKRPTLTAATLREMETNEVRAADALLTVLIRLPSDPAGPATPHVFVQWLQGGYSLLRNAVECFLVPVVLSRVPRRFPIRTRSCSGIDDDEASQEVIDLCRQRARKRGRHIDSSEDDDSGAELEAMVHKGKHTAATAAASEDSLLSPYSLPAALQEGLRKGVVRLEDLPPLRHFNDDEDEGEEAETDDSDASSSEA